MRLLLDECVPRPLLRDLSGYDVHHVVDLGWSSKRNGELLQLMIAERFEVLLTVDRNLPFQQNLRASGIAVVVAIEHTNRMKELRPLMARVREALAVVKAGQVITVDTSKET
jgi:predicted nuclease of predicted toxin-antitoxin system